MKKQIVHVVGNKKLVIDIRLSDDCKNGYDEFAMTADIYEKAKNNRWVNVGCGCCHEEILKYCPNLAIFEKLHLRNYIGQPMYAVENGLYWIKEGRRDIIKSHFLLNDDEIDVFMACEDKLHLKYLIDKYNISARWKALADEGIKTLEELCGWKYEPKEGMKIQDVSLSDEEKGIIEDRIRSGYYNQQEVEKRKDEQYNKNIDDALKKAIGYNMTKIQELEDENNIAKYIAYVLKEHKNEFIGYENVIMENYIYYNHRNQLVFNWANRLDEDKSAKVKEFVELLQNTSHAMALHLNKVNEIAYRK